MVIINIAGLLLVALIVWWFWLYKPAATEAAGGDLLVEVANGTYQPARIKLPAGSPVTLTFIRKDASPCAEYLQIPALQISETLPLNKAKQIHLPAMAAGQYDFHCQMQMYKGQLQVEA